MNPAQDDSGVVGGQPTAGQAGSVHKENPVLSLPVGENGIRDLSQELEMAPEVVKAGVKVVGEQMETPPDLIGAGVRPTGFSAPINPLPGITLPIDDEKIEKGLHESILSSLRWLAMWCIYKLKKVHLTILKIHGRVRRIRYQI